MNDFLPLERPKLEKRVDGYVLTWPDSGVAVEVERLTEGDNGPTCELTFYDIRGQAKLLFFTRLNLLYANGVSGVVKTLASRRSNMDWHGVMEQMTFLVIDHYRKGEPVIDLRAVPQRTATRWILEPYLEVDSPTVLFADGGIGKSTLALAMAVQVAGNMERLVGRMHGLSGPVVYYDWESDPAIHAERFRAICAGVDLEDKQPPVYYRRMVASLPEAAASMRKDVEKYKAVLAIVDSMGAARGGEPESADSTIRLFNAARSLGVAWLGVDHVTKNGSEGGAKKPFGSAFTHNLARVTWGMERTKEAGEDGSSVVCLTNHKANHGRLQRPVTMRLHYLHGDDEELLAVYFRPEELNNTEFADRAPLRERIMTDLTQGSRTLEELADDLGVKRENLRPRLYEMKREGKVVSLADRRWGLAANR